MTLLCSSAALSRRRLLAMCGCGGGSYSAPATTPTPTTPAATSVTVSIVGSSGNTAFSPNPVAVGAGNTLTFKNADITTHHIVLDDGTIDLGEMAPGATKSITAKASAVSFHCTIHSTMVGSINGATAPDVPPCTTPGYCD